MVDAIQCYDGDGTHNSFHDLGMLYTFMGRVCRAERRDGYDAERYLTLLQRLNEAEAALNESRPKVSLVYIDALETIDTFLMHFGIQLYESKVLFPVQVWVREAIKIARIGYRQW